MSQIILGSSSTAQWQKLVHDGEIASDTQLNEDLQSYLVFLLMRFLAKPDVVGRVMALEYLDSLAATGQIKKEQMRDVGDCCLLFSGFFPKIAEKRHVSVSYYVGIGQSAYHHLGEVCQEKMSQLFHGVGDAFVQLMDVLQAIRSFNYMNLLSPLEAFDLWQRTGSVQALKSLRQNTNAMPVFSAVDIKH